MYLFEIFFKSTCKASFNYSDSKVPFLSNCFLETFRTIVALKKSVNMLILRDFFYYWFQSASATAAVSLLQLLTDLTSMRYCGIVEHWPRKVLLFPKYFNYKAWKTKNYINLGGSFISLFLCEKKIYQWLSFIPAPYTWLEWTIVGGYVRSWLLNDKFITF